jgi:zinc D-Ala-D-Ala carboxypeptidase
MKKMFKYFTIGEFDCQHTGENEMDSDFIDKLDILRRNCGFSFVITSGYRSADHPIEAIKAKGGTHTQGIAADIRVRGGVQRAKLVSEAVKLGFTGIGVANSFIHVDTRSGVPVLWIYK